jgi:hypothetical protein
MIEILTKMLIIMGNFKNIKSVKINLKSQNIIIFRKNIPFKRKKN